MDDLRDEIRAAFEMEQSVYPPLSHLRPTLVEATVSRPPRERNFHRLAVAAALLLAVLVVAGLITPRLINRGSVHPAAPGSFGEDGPPPAGLPLIYVGDPGHAGWYKAIDWKGQVRGTIKLASPLGEDDPRLIQAPDGSGFMHGHPWQIFDRLGAPLVDRFAGSFQGEAWSDDSLHLCTLDFNPRQIHIGVRLPGAAPLELNAVAIDPSFADGLFFSSCTPSHDRAVLVYHYIGRPWHVWVVRLSDGAIVNHEVLDAFAISNLETSPDSALIAENSGASFSLRLGGAASSTVVVRASDGAKVSTLDPSFGVIAFSDDDATVLVTTSPYAGGVPTHLALLNVQTGAALWRLDGGDGLAGRLVEPQNNATDVLVTGPLGNAFALFLQNPHDSPINPPIQVLIVRTDGLSIAVAGTYIGP